MKLLTMFAAALACAAISPAEETVKAEIARVATTAPTGDTHVSHLLRKRATGSDNPSFSIWEAWSSFTLAGGGNLNLVSTGDYTGSDQVAVAIECPSATSLANSGLVVSWGNSLASNFTLTDVIAGSNFLLKNMGGGIVPAYGTRLMLQVVNTGTTPISCDQVTTYAVVH